MSRLASFKGPSSPSQLPVRPHHNVAPPSPSRMSETTHHRKVRTLLRELHTTAQNWDDLVLIDGLRAVQSLIDTRTELDNQLTVLPSQCLPPVGSVAPRINLMEKRLVDLESMLGKLQRLFDRMVTIIDSLDAVLYEACKTKGCKWVQEEPLWNTWTLEKFVTTAPTLLPGNHRCLEELKVLVATLRTHDTSFDASQNIIAKWITQSCVNQEWSDWEDLCGVEVERWESNQ
ncbi:hypothetical protein BU17DRAFT_50379 [Hysterangium stoloniferum]|nr:hypothetical protein BU17DRAFT_50379 [Hysterangium stoloniferum]